MKESPRRQTRSQKAPVLCGSPHFLFGGANCRVGEGSSSDLSICIVMVKAHCAPTGRFLTCFQTNFSSRGNKTSKVTKYMSFAVKIRDSK